MNRWVFLLAGFLASSILHFLFFIVPHDTKNESLIFFEEEKQKTNPADIKSFDSTQSSVNNISTVQENFAKIEIKQKQFLKALVEIRQEMSQIKNQLKSHSPQTESQPHTASNTAHSMNQELLQELREKQKLELGNDTDAYSELDSIIENGIASDGEIHVERKHIRKLLNVLDGEQRMELRMKIMQAINEGYATTAFYHQFF